MITNFREERTWAIAIQTVLREPKFRTEFPYFSREKRPEFRRKRDLCESLLTAMAQVLSSLILKFPDRAYPAIKSVTYQKSIPGVI